MHGHTDEMITVLKCIVAYALYCCREFYFCQTCAPGKSIAFYRRNAARKRNVLYIAVFECACAYRLHRITVYLLRHNYALGATGIAGQPYVAAVQLLIREVCRRGLLFVLRRGNDVLKRCIDGLTHHAEFPRRKAVEITARAEHQVPPAGRFKAVVSVFIRCHRVERHSLCRIPAAYIYPGNAGAILIHHTAGELHLYADVYGLRRKCDALAFSIRLGIAALNAVYRQPGATIEGVACYARGVFADPYMLKLGTAAESIGAD